MNEKEPTERALARYGAVSWIEQAVESGMLLQEALRRASERMWGERYYAASTLEEWYYKYRRSGFAALCRATRKDQGRLRALSAEAQEALLKLRREHPQLTVVQLIGELLKRGVLQPGCYSRSSVYRFLARCGLDRQSLRQGSALAPGADPTKAFESPVVNDLWMADMSFGPTLRLPARRVVRTRLFALIDDCSRLCTHGQYYASEQLACFLHALRQAIQRRGLPRRLYTDHGSVFVSRHLRQICAQLDIRLLHARPGHAWAKGKIERFFKTIQMDFEASVVLHPVAHLEELNERFFAWLEGSYHQRPHHGLEGKSPAARFASGSPPLCASASAQELQRLFLLRITRRVRKDATFSLHNRLWEVPPALRGQQITIRYDPFGSHPVEIYLGDQHYGQARPCDKHLNARTFFQSNEYES